MRSAIFAFVFVVLLAPVAPTVSAAQKKQQGRDDAIVFGAGDRRLITDYFGRTSLPPGLAKRGGNLPPGLAKQLRRNGKLPPGLQKRLTAFPDDLDRRLPTLPDIYRRGTIGDRAIIYDPRTTIILDVIDIFTRNRR
jgi:hypothetical protein